MLKSPQTAPNVLRKIPFQVYKRQSAIPARNAKASERKINHQSQAKYISRPRTKRGIYKNQPFWEIKSLEFWQYTTNDLFHFRSDHRAGFDHFFMGGDGGTIEVGLVTYTGKAQNTHITVAGNDHFRYSGHSHSI